MPPIPEGDPLSGSWFHSLAYRWPAMAQRKLRQKSLRFCDSELRAGRIASGENWSLKESIEHTAINAQPLVVSVPSDSACRLCRSRFLLISSECDDGAHGGDELLRRCARQHDGAVPILSDQSAQLRLRLPIQLGARVHQAHR